MERDIFNQWFMENISEWIGEAVETADPIYTLDDDNDILRSAMIFENIAAVIRAADAELEDYGYIISSASAYNLMAALLEQAIAYDWLDDPEQWERIIELFQDRAVELIDEADGIDIGHLDLPAGKVTSIADYIVRNWILTSKDYKLNEFTIDEKVFMIRSLLIGLRNSRYLKYDPWLKTLLRSLSDDWATLGGGFFGVRPPGPYPWSSGGV